MVKHNYKKAVIGGLAGGAFLGSGIHSAGKELYKQSEAKAAAAKHLSDTKHAELMNIRKAAASKAAEKASSVQGKISKYSSELKSAASGTMDSVKNMSPKAQMIAGGTAAALGAGLAAKRYLSRRKKKR